MAKTLNFNTLKRPTLPLVMMDEAQTLIKITSPSTALVEELQAVGPELNAAFKSADNDPAGIAAVYDLAARLMSHNMEGITVTVDDLRNKYKLGLEELVFFYAAYVDFIEEIKTAKN